MKIEDILVYKLRSSLPLHDLMASIEIDVKSVTKADFDLLHCGANEPLLVLPSLENPTPIKPTTDRPIPENPTQLNTKQVNTKGSNTLLIKYPSINQERDENSTIIFFRC